MKRDIETYLTEWRNSTVHKPILMRGARQVGKSWIVKEFAKSFDNFVEINFEENPQFKNVFSESLSPETIVPLLESFTGDEIIQGKTLLFFDEIQLCPNVIVSLRYFYEIFKKK